MRSSIRAIAVVITGLLCLFAGVTGEAQFGAGREPAEYGISSMQQRMPFSTAGISLRIEGDYHGVLAAASTSGQQIVDQLLADHPAEIEQAVKQAAGAPLEKVAVVTGRAGFQSYKPLADKEAVVALLVFGPFGGSRGGYGGGYGSIGSPEQVPEFTLGLNLWPEMSPEAANRILNAIGKIAVEEFPEYSRKHLEKLLAAKQKETEESLKSAGERVAQALNVLASANGLPPDKIADQLAEIDRQLLATRLTVETRAAREGAIQKALADTAENLDRRADDHRMLQSLRRIVELRRERHGQMQKSATANGDEVRKAEEELLAAIVDLDRTEAEFKQSSGGDQLTALTRELTQVTIDKAEDQARLKYLDEARLRVHMDLLKRQHADARVQEATQELAKAQKDAEQAQRRLKELKSAQDKPASFRLIVQQ